MPGNIISYAGFSVIALMKHFFFPSFFFFFSSVLKQGNSQVQIKNTNNPKSTWNKHLEKSGN